MGLLDELRRFAGIPVKADVEAKALLGDYSRSMEKVKEHAYGVAGVTRGASIDQIRSLLPDLPADAPEGYGVARMAAVMLESERVLRRHMAPRPDDGPLDPHMRAVAMAADNPFMDREGRSLNDHVGDRTLAVAPRVDRHLSEKYGGRTLGEHMEARTRDVSRDVDLYMSTGPARERAFDLEADLLHKDAIVRLPGLTIEHVRAHVRHEAAKARAGFHLAGDRMPGMVVSQARTGHVLASIRQAEVAGDPDRVSHMPSATRGWAAGPDRNTKVTAVTPEGPQVTTEVRREPRPLTREQIHAASMQQAAWARSRG